LTGPVALEPLQGAIGGGYLEVVPYFTQFEGRPCVAFCDDNGKRKGLPVNKLATWLWLIQLAASPKYHDQLCGNIAIVTGDEELMADL
jgi:hypothetical protein